MPPPLPETGLCMSTVCHAANGSLPALRKCWNCPWHCLHERESSVEKVHRILVPLRVEGRILQLATELYLPKGQWRLKARTLYELAQEGVVASELPLCTAWWLVQLTSRKALELLLAQTRVVKSELPLRKAL
ncbi:hypothetical protein PR001_g22602 [Phytophthora rubi]|uniref:Uncharacterized protein n=1 Tax=Phytophthora rubi TaxID=129364 RepID=A0A6A3J2E7_9STRA|nr:hypothetical protein PR001_g22602 [Phytophthora rubi]